ncbi:MAG: RluA family pseudouridine synthase [Christensenellales bacterium]
MGGEKRFEIKKPEERLDKYLARVMPLTRSHIKNAVLSGDVRVNGARAKPGDKLRSGDIVTVDISPPEPIAAKPEDIPIEIVYEDEWMAVVNKPQGMVVHPAPGSRSGTLVSALLFRLDGLSGINGQLRPGIVHRLDKDTSGLIVVAKNDKAHNALARQIADKSARRIYAAIVHGDIKQDKLTIDKPVGRSRRDRKKMAVEAGGRRAVTFIRVLERFGEYTFIEAELKTGRTHQIRVHLSDMRRPVAGDMVYGPKVTKLHDGGQLLHAKKLILSHPDTGRQMTFEAPLPDYFENALRALRGITFSD